MGGTAFHSTLDARLLTFNFAVAIAVSVLFSLAPAIQLLKPDLTSSLRQQTATMSGGILSFRSLIVSLQVGLSVLLLVGSGLFIRTMQNLRHVDPGFNTSHLVTFHVAPQLSVTLRRKSPRCTSRYSIRWQRFPAYRASPPPPSPSWTTATTPATSP